MDPTTLMAIGALVGLGKSEFIDKPNEQRQRNIEATKARYSPWTGIDAKNPAPTDYFGNTTGGALTGAAMAQSPWFNTPAAAADAGAGSGTMAGAVPLGDHPPSNTAPPYDNTPNHWNSGFAKGQWTTPAVRSY